MTSSHKRWPYAEYLAYEPKRLKQECMDAYDAYNSEWKDRYCGFKCDDFDKFITTIDARLHMLLRDELQIIDDLANLLVEFRPYLSYKWYFYDRIWKEITDPHSTTNCVHLKWKLDFREHPDYMDGKCRHVAMFKRETICSAIKEDVVKVQRYSRYIVAEDIQWDIDGYATVEGDSAIYSLFQFDEDSPVYLTSVTIKLN